MLLAWLIKWQKRTAKCCPFSYLKPTDLGKLLQFHHNIVSINRVSRNIQLTINNCGCKQ